jgi:UDP-N-acetylglucosamine acyltransferase
MASAHVAHDCVVGDRVIVANSVLLAGHVHVGENAFLGGNAMFHQFCRIGDGAMVSGGARIALDLPPFSLAAERNEVIGLNLIGLKRRGFSRETIAELKRVFHLVYFSAGNIRTIASDALASGTIVSAEARRFLSFFAEGKRGFARARSAGPTASEE